MKNSQLITRLKNLTIDIEPPLFVKHFMIHVCESCFRGNCKLTSVILSVRVGAIHDIHPIT
jgi:hypothetical protein